MMSCILRPRSSYPWLHGSRQDLLRLLRRLPHQCRWRTCLLRATESSSRSGIRHSETRLVESDGSGGHAGEPDSFRGAADGRAAAAAHVVVETQADILGWTVDVYIPAARLVVEIDGRSHVGREAED